MRLILPRLLAAMPAMASSPAAWAEGEAAARRACLRAAALAGARAAGPLLFSDTAGQTAFLVTGRYRSGSLAGRPAQLLCLFDRRHRRAEVAEAAGWRAP